MQQWRKTNDQAIIPLGSKRRGRGVELLHKAAAALGVTVPETDVTPYAPSGERYNAPQTPSSTEAAPLPETPSSASPAGLTAWESKDDEDAPEDVPAFSPVVFPKATPQGAAAATPQPISIPVEIGMNPQFIIQGTAGMDQDEVITRTPRWFLTLARFRTITAS